MQVLSRKDQFFCAVLGPEDIRSYVEAMKHLYSADNPELTTEQRKRRLWELRFVPSALIKSMLKEKVLSVFVLYEGTPKASPKFVGTAATKNSLGGELPEFCNDYIHSDYRGQHLIDLLYRARENELRISGQFNLVTIRVRNDNEACQNVVKRHDFLPVQKRDSYTIFEKTL